LTTTSPSSVTTAENRAGAHQPPAREGNEAVRINEESRLRALKIGLLLAAALSLLAIFRLPAASYKTGRDSLQPAAAEAQAKETIRGDRYG